jgi:predicted PurR-regulated permease PerM
MGKNININITAGTIWKTIAILFLFVALYYLRDLVLVILTSIVVASFVDLVIQKIGRFNWNRTLSVVLIYVVSFSILSGLFYIFMPVLLDEISGSASFMSDYFPSAKSLFNFPAETISGAKEISHQIAQNLPATEFVQGIKEMVGKLSGGFFDTMLVIFGGVFNLILIIVISFYLSIREKGIEGFLRIIIPDHYEDYVLGLWKRAEHRIALWVQGQFVLSLLIGILTYLGLMILGVKYALVLALITAIFELIPFGMILAVVPAIIFAYTDGGVPLALWVAGLYIVVHQFENYLIQPLVIKKVVGISPLVVILSLLIGFKLAGFWGLILAVPMAVAVLEFLDDLERHKIMAKEVHKT